MASAAAALLDQLMGRQRNQTSEEKVRHKAHFSDANICKFYLAGLSPYTTFQSTKSDLGNYDGVEDADCKAEWDALNQGEKDRYGYERDLLDFLSNLVSRVDRKISRSRERIRSQTEAEVREWQRRAEETLSPAEQARLATIAEELPPLVAEIDALGREGSVDAALAAVVRMEALCAERARLRLRLGTLPGTGETRLILCEVTGNFLSSADDAKLLLPHFQGRAFQGWKRVREKHRELLRLNPPRGVPGYAEEERRRRSAGGGGGRGGSGSRDRDRDREQEHRGRDGRSRGGRSSSRGQHRSDRSRSRSRDRGRLDRRYRDDDRRRR